MAGSVGTDPLGRFYRAKLRRASVNFLSAPVKDETTGTVIVLTTSDAQRTMLAYQAPVLFKGIAHSVNAANSLVVKVLSASPAAYSANPNFKLSTPPAISGTSISLVSVVQRYGSYGSVCPVINLQPPKSITLATPCMISREERSV